jgi:hypothetical protein
MIEKGLWPLFFIPGTAGFDTLRNSGFDTLRYSACLNSLWTEWSALADCIEGHNIIIADFDTLRTQSA